MKAFSSLLLCAVLAVPALGQTPTPPPMPPAPAPVVALAIVGPTQIDPYKLVKLSANKDATGAAVLWDLTPEDAADIIDNSDGKLTFTAPPGTYKIKLRLIRLTDGKTTAEVARSTVVIGTPTPPAPPTPPTPTDPLTVSLQSAYTLDTDAQKATYKASLAALYRNSATAVNDPNTKTYADLFAVLSKATATLMPAGSLANTRKAIGIELNVVLGTNAGATVDKAATLAEFAKIAQALDAVK